MFSINGENWGIKLVSSQHPKLLRTDGSLTIGSCDDQTKTIYINEDLNADLFKKVLCHEITHAAMFSYNIDLTYDQEELLADLISTYGQEIIITTNKIFKRIKEKGRF